MCHRIICSVAALALFFLGGCDGPTKAGKEARAAASDRMNIISAQVNYDQAKQCFDTGQFDKAQREIKHAIARYPEAVNYYVLQGRINLETSQLEAALDSLKTAIEKGEKQLENNSKTQQEKPAKPSAIDDALTTTLAEAYYFTGIVYQRWSDDDQSYRNYLKAFELAPTNAQYLLASAESLVAMGEYETAKQLIEPKMAYFEHNAALRQLQGQIALLEGNPKAAADLYADARLLSPDDDVLLEQMMWAQYAAGLYGQCHESIKMLEEHNKKQRPDLIHLEARCLNMMGRGPEARELYIELTKLCPSDPTIWTELASIAWDLGDYRRVAMASVQIIALAPERYEGYMFKGINERERGNLSEAAKLFQQSAKRSSDVALPYLLLGQTLERSGDVQGARDAYAQATQAEPNSAEAKELLRRLSENQRLSAVPVE